MIDIIRNHQRTLYEARLDAEFYAVFHARHISFWRKFRALIRFAAALVSAGAVASWLNKSPNLAALSGLSIAVLTALEQVLDPSEQLARHKEFARRYRLLTANRSFDLAGFDAALAAIHADVDAPGFDALRVPVFNDVVRASGRPDYIIKTTAWQRFVNLVA